MTMLRADSELYIQNPTVTDRRALHIGTVTDSGPETMTLSFEDVRFELAADQEIVIYFTVKRKFMQQAAKVVEMVANEAEHTQVCVVRTVGETVSAEGREHYRVSTVSANIKARLGKEKDCTLVDISAAGFAVICHTEHELGSTDHASVEYQGETYEGTVCIQSVRDIGRGRIRYGMRYLDDEAAAGTLKTGLRKVSIAVERQLLKNQSGRF